MGERVGSTPQQFDAAVGLQLFQFVGHGPEVVIGFAEVGAFRGDVAVVEAVVINAKLLMKVEYDFGAA